MVEDVLVPSDGKNDPDLAMIIMNPVTASELEYIYCGAFIVLGRPNWAYQSKVYQRRSMYPMSPGRTPSMA